MENIWITWRNPDKCGFYFVTREIKGGKRIAQNACFEEVGGWNVKGVIAWTEYPKAYSGEIA